MSNALKRKSKKMQPVGYSKKEISSINKYSKERSRMNNTTYNAYLDVRLIAYQILHDKFGFGQKRIIQLEETVNTYLEKNRTDKNMSTGALVYFLKEKASIDIAREVNMIPYRECVLLSGEQKPLPETGKLVAAAIYNYFALSCVALKTVFKFSANKLCEYMNWIRYYINTLSRKNQFDLTIKDIAVVLMDECKYCDARFVGGKV